MTKNKLLLIGLSGLGNGLRLALALGSSEAQWQADFKRNNGEFYPDYIDGYNFKVSEDWEEPGKWRSHRMGTWKFCTLGL